MLGTRSQPAEVPRRARPAPCEFPLEARVHLWLPLHHDPTGPCNQGLGQEPSLWPRAPYLHDEQVHSS